MTLDQVLNANVPAATVAGLLGVTKRQVAKARQGRGPARDRLIDHLKSVGDGFELKLHEREVKHGESMMLNQLRVDFRTAVQNVHLAFDEVDNLKNQENVDWPSVFEATQAAIRAVYAAVDAAKKHKIMLQLDKNFQKRMKQFTTWRSLQQALAA